MIPLMDFWKRRAIGGWLIFGGFVVPWFMPDAFGRILWADSPFTLDGWFRHVAPALVFLIMAGIGVLMIAFAYWERALLARRDRRELR